MKDSSFAIMIVLVLVFGAIGIFAIDVLRPEESETCWDHTEQIAELATFYHIEGHDREEAIELACTMVETVEGMK